MGMGTAHLVTLNMFAQARAFNGGGSFRHRGIVKKVSEAFKLAELMAKAVEAAPMVRKVVVCCVDMMNNNNTSFKLQVSFREPSGR